MKGREGEREEEDGCDDTISELLEKAHGKQCYMKETFYQCDQGYRNGGIRSVIGFFCMCLEGPCSIFWQKLARMKPGKPRTELPSLVFDII